LSELSGTKEHIFDIFVKMTSSLGYENVSMRDIAEKVGIQVASIYNHFESKGKILDFTYDYYMKHLYDNRKPVDEIKKLVETASAEEILNTLDYTFETDDQKKYERMILITKIIYMRLFQDPAAKAIFAENDRNSADYVTAILKYGVNIGRIDPNFDIEIFTEVFIGAKEIMGIRAFADAAYVTGQIDKEPRILSLFVRLLSASLLNTTPRDEP